MDWADLGLHVYVWYNEMERKEEMKHAGVADGYEEWPRGEEAEFEKDKERWKLKESSNIPNLTIS